MTFVLTYSSALEAASNVLQLGGGGSVSEAAVADFPVAGMTISFWLRTTDTNANSILFSYDGATNDTAHRLWIRNPGSLEIRFGTSSTTGATGIRVNDGAWHQIAVTIAPSDATHYAVCVFKDGMPAFYGAGALTYPRNEGLRNGRPLLLGGGIATEPGFSGTMSEFRLLNLVQTTAQVMTMMRVRLPQNDPAKVIHWALTSPATSGTLNGDAVAGVASDLQFRTQQLTALWTTVTGADRYELEVTSSDGWRYTKSDIPAAATSWPVPGYSVNATYSGRVRAWIGSDPQPWSNTATATTLDLQQPSVSLVNPSGVTLTMQWPAVDQAQQYAIAKAQDQGEPAIDTQTGTSYDLTTLVQSESAWSVAVAAQSLGAGGPITVPPSLTAPVLTFAYTAETQKLTASWEAQPNVVYWYLQITNTTTGQSITNAFYPASTLQYDVPSPVAGNRYTARLRAIGAGSVAAWSQLRAVTVYQLPGPVVVSLTADLAAKTITATWTFDYPGVTATFDLELRKQGTAWPVPVNVGGSSYTYPPNPDVVAGATFEFRMRATADGSAGLWSATATLVAGAPPAVTGLTASSAANRDVTVGWTAVSTAGATYKVRITGNGIDYTQDPTPPTNTTTTLLASNTHVESNKTYTVEVWAIANAQSGPKTSVSVLIEPPHDTGGFTFLDPVDTTTGAYLYQHVELAVYGVMPLLFVTSYNSSTPLPGESPLFTGQPLGNRWTHSYNIRLVRSNDGKKIYSINGSDAVQTFLTPASISGSYTPEGLSNGRTLVLGTDMIFVLTDPNRQRYRYTYGGQLFEIVDPAGNKLELTYYGDGSLKRVTDSQIGCYFEMTYDGGNLRTLSDGLRTVRFDVGGGNLRGVTSAMQKNRAFEYTGSSLLQKVKDERQKTIVTNTYSNGKVIFQQDARAVESGQNYGSTFDYAAETRDGVEYAICNITDRAGHRTRVETMKNNGRPVLLRYELDATIKVIQREYDGYLNLVRELVYEGPSADYVPGRGNEWRYTYVGYSNLHTTRDPLLRTATNEYYNDTNLVRSATDFDGNTTTYEYDGNLLQKITPPIGGPTIIQYESGNIRGLIAKLTDRYGNTTNYSHQNGRLLSSTNPLGGTLTYAWTPWGGIAQVVTRNAAGTHLRTVRISYWDSGLVRDVKIFLDGQSENEAFVTHYTWDDANYPETATSATGVLLTYRYNANGYLDRITYPAFRGATRETNYVYDRIDYPQKQTYSLSVSVEESYDQLGRQTLFKDANKQSYPYSRTMDLTGNAPYPLLLTLGWPLLDGDPTVYTERWTYDPAGRLIEHKNRGGAVTSVAYTTRTDPSKSTAKQIVATRTLPPAHSGDPRFTVVTIFNALGQIVSATNESQKTTTFDYSIVHDATSNTNRPVVTITDAAGRVRALTYDALGRLVSDRRGSEASGALLTYVYDDIDRLLQSSEQSDITQVDTRYTYAFDSTSKCIKVTIGSPGAAPTRTLYYNGVQQLVRDVDANGHGDETAYTPWGAVASYKNRRAQQIDYDFDLAGRLTSVSLGQTWSIVHTLDDNGNRLRTQRAPQPPIVRTFDRWNRLKTRTDANGKMVEYAYWATNQVKSLFYSDRKKVDFFIDGLQRTERSVDWADRTTRYGYMPDGFLQAIRYANGTEATLAYDDGQALLGITHKKDNALLAQVNYSVDALGRPLAGTSVLPLAPAFPTQPVSMEYGPSNEMSSYNGTALSYDDDGNLLSLPSPAGLRTLAWDVFNNVTGNGADAYAYDDDGMLAAVTSGGTEARFVHDVNGWLAPPRERGDPVRRLAGVVDSDTMTGLFTNLPIYGGASTPLPLERAIDHILELADAAGTIRGRYVYGPAGLIGFETATGEYLSFHADPAGSILALTNASADITDRYASSPFGERWGTYGPNENPFVFGGRDGVYDFGNGLLSMRNRPYGPALLRFGGRDFVLGNLRRPQTLNDYAYVVGNPLQGSDPLGLFLVGVAVVAGIGLGIAAVAGIGYGIAYAFGFVGAGAGAVGAGAGAGAGAEGYGRLPTTEDIELQDLSSDTSSDSTPPTSPRTPTLDSGWRQVSGNQYVQESTGNVLTRRNLSQVDISSPNLGYKSPDLL